MGRECPPWLPAPGTQALALALLAAATVSCRRSSALEIAARGAASANSEGAELVGRPAPGWEVSDWINSSPLTVAGLRGKVVLIRWFTDTECPYCTATAPALNQLHADFAGRGLTVIGLYHHKRPEPMDVAKVRAWSREYGFHFPVAVDRDWRTLRRWWLNGSRDFTSVSFLLDQGGIIRRVHPGGSMALGSADYRAMRTSIENLLPALPAQPAAAPPGNPPATSAGLSR